MTDAPELDEGAWWESLADLRERITAYDGGELFADNEQLRFDRLLVDLERESRSHIEDLIGDEPLTFESDRVDELDATADVALWISFPVRDVSKVEIRRRPESDWRELDRNWYEWNEHRLILRKRSRRGTRSRRRNPLTGNANRATWGDIADKVRVTYDRGWDPVRPEVKAVQRQLINRMLRSDRLEQQMAAASPDQFAGVSPQFDQVFTEDMKQRLDDLTGVGGGRVLTL